MSDESHRSCNVACDGESSSSSGLALGFVLLPTRVFWTGSGNIPGCELSMI